MVMAEEVKESVDYQVGHVVFKRLRRKRRFPADSFGRQYDITKKRPGFLREGKNVGCFVLSAVARIQPAHARIVGENHAQLPPPLRGRAGEGGSVAATAGFADHGHNRPDRLLRKPSKRRFRRPVPRFNGNRDVGATHRSGLSPYSQYANDNR